MLHGGGSGAQQSDAALCDRPKLSNARFEAPLALLTAQAVAQGHGDRAGPR